ncbi:SigB/SigF/SigG family RNA polymerase sigma factor [Dactylosporangium aurantiacum]|uniref:Anti-sigma factor antagonist n=1 Tax=Dactylosporangium aurantiacum TaxID=35754 RepID=A0A9Q9IRH6_9ACTN|nr:SigB/SigF/SigG family RNA polymerase sigma factor [Dactylosporangium aurantiacum]MDG6110382.1 SigB/SigF/SigG family RNA polymerase sigma factor [Dactylosporangium aurantiacum]UWZ58595.1 SigB/SigF/SigG family RNA polymerase sigma factor [Dactylosporangium aurantiacum]
MNLTITRSNRGTHDMVRVGGCIDASSVPYLRQVLFDLFDSGRHRIVVGVAEVRLIDAASVRVLLYLRQRAKDDGGYLRLAGATGTVRQVLEIAGVAKALGIDGGADFDDDGSDAIPVDLDGLRLTGRHWPADVTGELTRLHTGDLDPAASARMRDAIVRSCIPAAQRLAHRYSRSAEPAADLEQVACVGLLKAVDGFDPGRGTEFPVYATTTIVGELRRHFRDRVWSMHVPRHLQELWLEVRRSREELTSALGRSPGVQDIAEHLDLNDRQVAEVIGLGSSFRPLSLNVLTAADDVTIIDQLGGNDPQLGHVEYRESLRVLLAQLPARSQRILALRYYGGLTQHEIADHVGLSQMHVSRILRQALQTLRRRLEEIPG